MDAEALVGYLDERIGLMDEARRAYDNLGQMSHDDQTSVYADDQVEALERCNRALVMSLPALRRIAAAMTPDKVSEFEQTDYNWPWSRMKDPLLELRGLVADGARVDEMLRAFGPQLSAGSLHEWVWSAAASFWRDGYRRAAIQAAATQIDNHLQAKLNRNDVSGVALVRQAFTLDSPDVGRPRLRRPGFEHGSEAWKSAHEGAASFGAGCMQAIRNLATHRLEEPDEQPALEQLAALSVLARWIDESEIARDPADVRVERARQTRVSNLPEGL